MAGAIIDVRVVLATMIGIINRAHTAHQTRAINEHQVSCNRQTCSGPLIAHDDGLQRSAALEHLAHIAHVGRVETAQVKRSQRLATKEHCVHICHILGVERSHIN